ncbi:hypothetical protein Ssi03_75410 [Sphaerisporangium siamense]|uniref:Uncharacterized protein n=1 Tax=Sphaerisporangium siamense TaxID=795645 RepID=A0A7W7D5I5_9ACTN|nr:hypothetical protein [Sphaerisporangium siamense]MBB4700680.1 hypothetical protein [Sphaerisporangium siamense]GII89551.1 hypothetical protein Ssi03_75410 [Sphaerisporangium siamense]
MSSAFLYLGIVLMWLCVLVPMWLRRDRHSIDVIEPFGVHEDRSDPQEPNGDTLTDVPVSDLPGTTSSDDDEITVELDNPATPRGQSSTGPLRARPSSPTDLVRGRPSSSTDLVRGGPSQSAELARGGPSQSAEFVRGGPSRSAEFVRGGPSKPDADPIRGERLSASEDSADAAPVSELTAAEESARDERRRRARVVARRRRWLLCIALLHIASLVTAAVGVAPWWSVAPSAVLLVAYLSVLRVAVAVDRERHLAAAEAYADHQRRQREHRHARELAAQRAEAEIIEFRKPTEPFDQHADHTRRAVGD